MHAQVPGLARSLRLCLVTVTQRKQVGWGDATWGRILSRHRSLRLRKEKGSGQHPLVKARILVPLKTGQKPLILLSLPKKVS